MRWLTRVSCHFEVEKADSPSLEALGCVKKRKTRQSKPKVVNEILEPYTRFSDSAIEMLLLIKTVSEGNCFEAWQKKHARHKAQKLAISLEIGRAHV